MDVNLRIENLIDPPYASSKNELFPYLAVLSDKLFIKEAYGLLLLREDRVLTSLWYHRKIFEVIVEEPPVVIRS